MKSTSNIDIFLLESVLNEKSRDNPAFTKFVQPKTPLLMSIKALGNNMILQILFFNANLIKKVE